VDSAETDRCPRRYITPLSLWLLAQYNAGNLATIWRNGPSPVQACAYGADMNTWPAWWADAVAALTQATNEANMIELRS